MNNDSPRDLQVSGAGSAADDVDLLLRLDGKNPDTLGALYDRYGRVVFTLASRILNDARESEEVTQDVFLAIWKKPDSYDPKKASPITWLATLTRNKCIDRMRKAGRRIPAAGGEEDVPVTVDENPTSSPFLMSALSDLSEQVHSCLSRLSDSQRTAVESAYFDSLSMTEISKKLSVPSGTVKSRIRLAMDKLRSCLGPRLDEE